MNQCRIRGWTKFLVWALAILAVIAGSSTEVLAQTFGTGTFQGILQSDSNNDESFGFITLVLSRTGAFSMRFNMGVNKVGYHNYVKSGKFDDSGHYHFEGPDPHDTRFAVARVIDLQLDSVDNPTKITGTMTDLTHSSNVEMDKVILNQPGSPFRGPYTFLFSSSDAGVPNSTGFGRAVVTTYGHVVANGRLPDGRTFSAAGNVTMFDRWPVFAKTVNLTNGILSGWITFQDTASSDFSGTLTWLGREVPGPNHAFVPEFSGDVNVVGSRYVVPQRAAVLNVDASTNNLHLTLSDGGLETQIDRNVTLTQGNRVIFSPRLAGDSMTVNPATGTFSGTFKHSDGRTYPFFGAVLQKQNRGGGVFVDVDKEPGTVAITPNAGGTSAGLPFP